ncbi:SDR family oxidoreductase [Rhodococcus erythropolis]|uniref:NAD(P)-dependent oxidoreductase n=1 Tax=Rhodococcus erythropolis TaxID=1833 RepID=UPI00210A4028|nr:NAD(P)-binding oxidoreductase [Rhodococcus erythropolis]MCQ4129173.1 SDR family oxidoreductase [Rhodococcus erythropolis]
MKLLILGGTGPTGRHLIDQAICAGDTVAVLARKPAALAELARQVTLFHGDATVESDISAAMTGQDAVVSALGAGKSVVSDMFPRAAAVVIDSMQKCNVSRLVWLSSFGVGETFREASMTQKMIYRTLLRSIYPQKAIADSLIRASDRDWTVVYPVALTHKPAVGSFRVGDHLPMQGNASISRADVAAFMLDAARGSEWIGRSPIISS